MLPVAVVAGFNIVGTHTSLKLDFENRSALRSASSSSHLIFRENSAGTIPARILHCGHKAAYPSPGYPKNPGSEGKWFGSGTSSAM